jgi:YD repeat-containing protein
MPKTPENALNSSLRSFCLSPILAFLVVSTRIMAQAVPDIAEGYIPYQVYSESDIDSVSMQSGNLLLDIPVISYPQRGKALNLQFSLHYSNAGWRAEETAEGGPVSEQWANEGPISVTFALDGAQYSYTTSVLLPGTGNGNIQENPPIHYGMSTIYSSDGSAHALENGWSTDGTGLSALGSAVIDRSGIRTVPIQDPNPNYSYAVALEDTDGNEITQNSTGWVDTVGRSFPATLIPSPNLNPENPNFAPDPPTPLQPPYLLLPGVPTAVTSLCPAGTQTAYKWLVPAPTSSPTAPTATYTFCYQTITYASNFGYPDIAEAGGSAMALIALVLPNQTSWQFTYDTWGELTSVVYPTGGSVSYQWTTIPYGIRAVQTRTISSASSDSPNAMWSYQWGVETGSSFNVETAPPDQNGVKNDTTYEQNCSSDTTEVKYFSGSSSISSNLLKTVDTTFMNTPNPYGFLGTNYLCPINHLPLSVTTTWPNGQISKVTTTYDPGVITDVRNYNLTTQKWTNVPNVVIYGVPILKQEYDFGASTPTRQTLTTYEWQEKGAYGAANLLTLPASVVTEDGTGNRVAETDYAYDESAYLTASGITLQASPPNGSTRGNPTSITEWLNNGASPVSHTNWYDTGEVYKQIDPLNHTTTFNYSATYSGSLPTTVTNPLDQTSTYVYDFNVGKVTSITDPNSEITTYTYADSLARLTNVTYPDNGQTSYQYNDTASPVNVTVIKSATPNPSVEHEYDVDGLGREYQSKLLTDPDGIDYVQTTYDGPGRTSTVTNPYRTTSDPTYGSTQYFYDGLNRKTKETEQDGSVQQWSYSGSTVSYTDQNNNAWQRTSDGLGRLTTVLEPNGYTQTATMQTSYSYDVLNNLLSVTQFGGPSGSPGARNRSFTYDSLSRLLTAMNPETGTVCYGVWSGVACANGYDADGNLKEKTDARGIVTNYLYDLGNRLLSKTYSNDSSHTLTSCYQYDVSPLAGSNANLVGRLTNEWTQSASAGSCASALPSSGYWTRRSILQYDAMGRTQYEQQCTPSNCGSPTTVYSPAYNYDYAGNIESSTNGISVTPSVGTLTLSSAFEGAGHLLSLTSNWTSTTSTAYPPTVFSTQTSSSTLPCPGASAAFYTPFGMLQNATYGNGVQINRTFDSRLRITCETDTASPIANASAGSATVMISGQEQSK